MKTHQSRFNHRRKRSEKLDWRQIASLDIDKLEEDSDFYEELCTQIVGCKAEVEFEPSKIDPGFCKVFQICQIIIENFMESRDGQIDLEEIKKNFEIEKKKLLEENGELKESLLVARRELKKRRDTLAHVQNEILDHNKDEYDQCPYCSKRFLASFYLYSHIQRRHQGLPIPLNVLHNVFPIQALKLPLVNSSGNLQASTTSIGGESQGQVNYPSPQKTILNQNTIETQTETGDCENDSKNPNGVDLVLVSDLVEQYLERKTSQKSQDEELQQEGGEVKTSSSSSRPTEVDEAEEKLNKMKEQLEDQWKNLAEKIHQSGIEELKNVLMSEMNKMHEIIKINTKVEESDQKEDFEGKDRGKNSPGLLNQSTGGDGEGQEIIQVIENKMQKKSDNDDFEAKKLEAQERYWRSKLRQVEEQYREQISELRQEIQSSMSVNSVNDFSSPRRSQGQIHFHFQPQQHQQIQDKSPGKMPIAKPRRTRTPQNQNQNPQILQNEIPTTEATSRSRLTHRYEESSIQNSPQNTKFDRNQDEDEELSEFSENSSGVSDHDLPSEDSDEFHLRKVQNVPTRSVSLIDRFGGGAGASGSDSLQRPNFSGMRSSPGPGIPNSGQQVHGQIVRSSTNPRMDQIRAQVVSEMNRQMEEMGINPDGTEARNREKFRVQKLLEEKRQSIDGHGHGLNEELVNHRESYREGLKDIVKMYKYEQDFEKAEAETSLKFTPSSSNSKSPIVKMFSAVKTQGQNFHKKVSLAVKKRHLTQQLVSSPKKVEMKKPRSRIHKLFSKMSRSKGKNKQQNDNFKQEMEEILSDDNDDESVDAVETEFSEPESEQQHDRIMGSGGRGQKQNSMNFHRQNSTKKPPRYSLTQKPSFGGGESDSDLEVHQKHQQQKLMKPRLTSASSIARSRANRPKSASRPKSGPGQRPRSGKVVENQEENLNNMSNSDEIEMLEPLIVVRPKKSSSNQVQNTGQGQDQGYHQGQGQGNVQASKTKAKNDGIRVEYSFDEDSSDGSIESLYIPDEEPKNKDNKGGQNASKKTEEKPNFIPKNSWDDSGDDENIFGDTTEGENEIMYNMGIKSRPPPGPGPTNNEPVKPSQVVKVQSGRNHKIAGVFSTTPVKNNQIPPQTTSTSNKGLKKSPMNFNNSWDSLTD